MYDLSIGDVQKNISILSNLKEAVRVIDKRRRKVVAIVYPVKESNIVSKLAGKYRSRIKKGVDLEKAKQEAMTIVMREKYGRLD